MEVQIQGAGRVTLSPKALEGGLFHVGFSFWRLLVSLVCGSITPIPVSVLHGLLCVSVLPIPYEDPLTEVRPVLLQCHLIRILPLIFKDSF